MDQSTISNIIGICAFLVSLLSLFVAITACIFTALSYASAKKINRTQIENDFNNYILNDFLVPFSELEADLMLVLDGTDNKKFTKEYIDILFMNMFCKAKSYSKVINNDALFKYADDSLSNPKSAAGNLIEDYFELRNKFLKKTMSIQEFKVEKKKMQLRIRRIRDDIINNICYSKERRKRK